MPDLKPTGIFASSKQTGDAAGHAAGSSRSGPNQTIASPRYAVSRTAASLPVPPVVIFLMSKYRLLYNDQVDDTMPDFRRLGKMRFLERLHSKPIAFP